MELKLRQRFNNTLKALGVGAQILTLDDIQREFKKAFSHWSATRRAPAYAGRVQPSDLIIEPQWNYVALYRLGLSHHILRRIVEAIIKECTKDGGEIQERFKGRCNVCGHEYKKELDACESEGCPGTIDKPDPDQRKIIEAFIKNPNKDDEWMDIIKSILRFTLTVDDWYLWVPTGKSVINLEPYGFAEQMETQVVQAFVLDSRYIRIAADMYGRLGKREWFCPDCYDAEKEDTSWSLTEYKKYLGKCPKCSGDLMETAYIWREIHARELKGRFFDEEVIHGNSCPMLPHLYGMPKAVAALRPLHTLTHMIRFNLENFSQGKVDKMVFVSGVSQEELNDIIKEAKTQSTEKIKRSLTTGQRKPPALHTLAIGLDDINAKITVVDAMPDPSSMQSLEWYKQHVEDVSSIFGVTPKFEGIAEAGKQGSRMVIDVDNKTAEEHQLSITNVLDEQLWPKLGVTDWVWRFNPVEQRDRLMDARIDQLNVDTAIKAARGKMKVELEEDGELKVSGVPKPPEPQPGMEQESDEMKVEIPGESPSSVESPWERKKAHSLTKCMECDAPPTVEVLWAEGMGHAWFCKQHFEEWKKKANSMSNTGTYEGDIVATRNITGKASEHWSKKSNDGKAWIVREIETRETPG